MTDWFEWLEEQEPLEDREPVRVFPDPLDAEEGNTMELLRSRSGSGP